jgi:hypothetical protein
VRDFERQVSYYSGRDSDGDWSEGGPRESIHLSAVPAGRYFLRVAPEGGEPGKPLVHYSVTVTRDVPSYLFYLFAGLALLVPVALAALPAASFEGRRWAESDYAGGSGDDSDDEDE